MTTPTQGEHAQTEALRPKFGDLLRNTMASESNPHRDAYFIREVHRSGGGVNPGRWFEMTDGKGETWLSNPQNLVPAATAQPAAPQGVAYAELPECGAIGEQAGAWMTIVHELDVARPGWTRLGQTGEAAAVAAIQKLASHGQAPAKPAAQEVTAFPSAWKDDLFAEMQRRFDLRRAEDDFLPFDDTQLGVEFAMGWLEQRWTTTTAQAAPAADYDHGPQSLTVAEAARHVGKWLNERPNRPLDLRDVAMLCAYAQKAPAAGAVAGPDGRMSDELRSLIEGMTVSVDVSTGDHDAGNRYFGTVTEVMDDISDKHGVTLLVQDAKPNFAPTPAAQADSVTAPAGSIYRNSVTGEFELDYANKDHPKGAHVDFYLERAQAADSVQDLQPVHDAGTIELLNERVAYLEGKLKEADSVLEDAARKAIEKVLALFPFNVPIQKFTINNGPCLTADNDDEFYSVKRVLAFLTEIKTTLDAARKQGGA